MTGPPLFPPELTTDRRSLVRLGPDTVRPQTLYDYRNSVGNASADPYAYADDAPPETVWAASDALEAARTRREQRDGVEYLATTESASEPLTDPTAIVGSVDLTTEWDRRTARIRVTVSESERRTGLGTELADSAISVAFDRLGLDVALLDHAVGNDAGRGFVESLVERYGGQRDCLLRNWRPTGESVLDVERYAVTAEQFREASVE